MAYVRTPPPADFDMNAAWDPDWCWWLLKETEKFQVVVQPMLFNDRVSLFRRGSPLGPVGGWCYPKGGRAFLFGLAFDPETEPRPEGWFRDLHGEGYDHTQPGAPPVTEFDRRRPQQ